MYKQEEYEQDTYTKQGASWETFPWLAMENSRARNGRAALVHLCFATPDCLNCQLQSPTASLHWYFHSTSCRCVTGWENWQNWSPGASQHLHLQPPSIRLWSLNGRALEVALLLLKV